MALPAVLTSYLDDLTERTRPAFFVERFFRNSDDWEKWSAHDWRGRRFGNEPGLDDVLANQRVAIVGEPGAGKSTIAAAAVAAAISRGWVPILLTLRSYRGDLDELVDSSVPPEAKKALTANPELVRLYILDGFDESPAEFIDAFLEQLDAFVGPSVRLLLTSRQAFFINRRQRVGALLATFHLLDLDGDDLNRFIDRHGVDRSGFYRAADEAQLVEELANPFALDTLLSYYKAKGHLGSTRSEVLGDVIAATLASRPSSSPKRELQSLRMLALAMEMAAKNELLEEEAVTVLQTAFGVERDEAAALLEQLAQSILIRTQGGYAFQMRSYGEYLAALELADIRERDRVLEPLFLIGTREPHDSWRNAVSYLVEQSRAARIHFSKYYPDWLLNSSPAVFSEQQKNVLTRALVERMRSRQEYLIHHPTIRARQLARLLTQDVRQELRAALGSANDVEVANALLLLGVSEDRTIAQDALQLGLDETRSHHLRHSALSALSKVGSPEMIPRLLAIEDWDEPTVISRIDAASSLMDEHHVGLVIDALARTDVLISSAYYAFGELTSPVLADAILQKLATLQAEGFSGRLGMYLAHFWPRVVQSWKPEWAPLIARVLLKLEGMGDESSARKLAEALLNSAARPQVSRSLVELFATKPSVFAGHQQFTFELIALEDVQWLEKQPNAADAINNLRVLGAEEVQAYLRPSPIGYPGQTGPRQPTKWERRQLNAEERNLRLKEIARNATDSKEIVAALFSLDEDKWPDISRKQRDLLEPAIDRELSRLNLRERIVWESDTRWTVPQNLSQVMQAIDRYGLRLTNDRELVQALRAGETPRVVRYHKRHGLSADAVDDIDAMAFDDATPSGAMDGVIDFIADAKLETEATRRALASIILGGRPYYTRRKALFALGSSAQGRDLIASNLNGMNDDLREAAEDILIEVQHRPTIERRLARLLNEPSLLNHKSAKIHFEHSLAWLRKLRLPEVWTKLVQLRRVALQQGADQVEVILTDALAAINPLKVSEVVLAQVDDAPADWRPIQRIRAVEHQRDGRIRAAQKAPFEAIVARLKAFSTMNRFKIWVEGPNDLPPAEVLCRQVSEKAAGGHVVAQMFGGWAQILNDNWTPLGLGDGCSDFIVLLDGDRGRDWSQPDHPLRPEPDVRKVLKKLEEHKIEYRVLERYAIENYFPRSAFEAVLGRPLAAHFPLDNTRSVESQIPGYSKHMNGALAEATNLSDLEGTDLGALLHQIGDRISE